MKLTTGKSRSASITFKHVDNDERIDFMLLHILSWSSWKGQCQEKNVYLPCQESKTKKL